MSDDDAAAAALRRLLATDSPPSEWFEPEFLRRYPIRRVEQTLGMFLDRHGALVDVEPDGERWHAVYEHGGEPVVARVTPDGLIAGLGIGSDAVARAESGPLPYREWPRSTIARRIALGMAVPTLAPPALAAAAWTVGSSVHWIEIACLAALVCADAWFVAPWHVLSRAIREPVVGGSVVAVAASAVRLPGLPGGGFEWWLAVAGIAIAAVVLRPWATGRRRRSSESPLELRFPLAPGTYDVAQGGPAPLNQHAVSEAQRAALDIVALGRLGARCAPPAIYPDRLDRYVVFDRPVVAPCDGVVVDAVDGVPDLRPPLRTPDRGRGNYVAIEAHGAVVVLAHLRLGTVLPAEGDRIAAGQPIGRVGNSGSSTEPHLHIHAERNGVAVPLVFPAVRRRPLRRNDVVRI